MTRKTLSKKVRFEVFKRDLFKCQYCGNHPPDVVLNVDHIMPVAKGGSDDMDNLITSCEACNSGKSANLLTSVPRSLKDKAMEVAEKEAQYREYAKVLQARRERIEQEVWEVAEELNPGASKGMPRAEYASIKKFIERLGYDSCLDAAEIGRNAYPFARKRAFLYFCGVCWKRIRTLEGNSDV